MKKCTKCNLEKNESEFFFKNKLSKKLHSHCKDCKREIDRIAYKKEGNIRAIKIRLNAIESINRAKEFVTDYKKKSKCKECPESRWYVLDFHHLFDKYDSVSNLVRKGSSINKIKNEILKCIILCSNCHREFHHFQNIKNGVVAPIGRAKD